MPFEISILNLGISGFASALNIILKNNINNVYIFIPRLIIMFFVLISFLTILVISILNRKKIFLEFKNHNFSQIVPTFFMTLSNIGNFIGSLGMVINNLNGNNNHELEQIFYLIGTILMYIGLILHLLWWLFIIYLFFIHHRLSLFKHSLGSWGVPFVGMAIFCANTSGMINDFKYLSFNFNQVIWWFSFINFLILFPCLVIRHFKFKLNDNQLNSAAVFAAPPCLLLAGFINTFCQDVVIKQTIFIYSYNFINGFIVFFIIFCFALIIFLLIWIFVAKNNKLYNIAAFTFPFAINTIAISNVVSLSKSNFNNIILISTPLIVLISLVLFDLQSCSLYIYMLFLILSRFLSKK